MSKLNGCIIAESLNEPSILNVFPVTRAFITPTDRKIDDHGGRGRWHLYWVTCEPDAIDTIQRDLKRGWYAHFWSGNAITVVYADQRFPIRADDCSTWADAIAHGRACGIPDDELDFVTF